MLHNKGHHFLKRGIRVLGVSQRFKIRSGVPNFHSKHKIIHFYVLFKMQHIALESNDNKCFKVDVEIAKHLGIIRDMIEDVGMRKLEDENFKISNVDGCILEKVIEWATHHKDNPVFTGNIFKRKLKITDLSEWDKNFVKANEDALFKIIDAAEYLNIQPLLYVCCKYIADEMKGKNMEQIRERFNTPRTSSSIETEQSSQNGITDVLMEAEG